MSDTSRGTDSALFEFKSASMSVVALILRSSDLDELSAAMAAQFGDMPTVFDHDPVIIDLAQLGADGAEVDFAGLDALLRRQRLVPAAVRGGSADQMAAALAAGLGEAATSGALPTSWAIAESAPVPGPESGPDSTHPSGGEASEVAAPVGADLPATALTIERPLRSGQQVYAKGGDLIVLAAVNFGAEVLADGNIHVYGPLRGKAVAGAKGNVDARIFSTCMEPELVAIAGTYRTTENPLPAEVIGKPAQIKLVGDRLVFEPLA